MRREYLKNGEKLLELISSIPFGYFFQGLRVVRLIRILRILRIVFRARRFRGAGRRAVRVFGIVGATVFAGAMALRTVEPATVPEFTDALWWSLVTLSTVGYGDIVPSTVAGKMVGGALIVFGIGVFGYVAGFMSALLDDEEDEIIVLLKRMDARLEGLEVGATQVRASDG